MTKLLAINNSVTVDDRGNVTQLFLFIAGFAVVGAAATSYLFFYYLYKIKIMKQSTYVIAALLATSQAV